MHVCTDYCTVYHIQWAALDYNNHWMSVPQNLIFI